MMYYNTTTGELTTAPPWGISVQVSEDNKVIWLGSDWQEVADDFEPTVDMEPAKAIKVARLKAAAPDAVYSKAPQYKQANAALGILSVEDVKTITDWIQTVRKVTSDMEREITAATDSNTLEGIAVTTAAILARAKTDALGQSG